MSHHRGIDLLTEGWSQDSGYLESQPVETTQERTKK